MDLNHLPCEIDYDGDVSDLQEDFKAYETSKKTDTGIYYDLILRSNSI